MADKLIQTLEQAIKDLGLNTTKDLVITIEKGVPKVLDKPHTGFGENVITWVDGRINHDRVSYTNKR